MIIPGPACEDSADLYRYTALVARSTVRGYMDINPKEVHLGDQRSEELLIRSTIGIMCESNEYYGYFEAVDETQKESVDSTIRRAAAAELAALARGEREELPIVH